MRETDAASSMELTQEDIAYRENGRGLNLISFSLSSKNLKMLQFLYSLKSIMLFSCMGIMYHVWVRMITGI